jgi:hypothetical protein
MLSVAGLGVLGLALLVAVHFTLRSQHFAGRFEPRER